MRDGVVLYADITLPDSSKKVPCILTRLPYSKDNIYMQLESLIPMQGVESGYAVVYQDTRGCYESEGKFQPFFQEINDGYDTVEWLAAQKWCDGNIGMAGTSYAGATQWLAALSTPPHLKAIFPIFTASDYYNHWTYDNGVLRLGFLALWLASALLPNSIDRLSHNKDQSSRDISRLALALDNFSSFVKNDPCDLFDFIETKEALYYYEEWLQHESFDSYWKKISIRKAYDRIQVPAYNVGGWFDLFINGTIENYCGMKKHGSSMDVCESQYLLIGPWAHGNFSGVYRDINFGHDAVLDFNSLNKKMLNFFDRYLKHQNRNSSGQEKYVRLFVMGSNEWRSYDQWPLKGKSEQFWYFHKNGILDRSEPEMEPPDEFIYDPTNPVLTSGGNTFLQGFQLGLNAGPLLQESTSSRSDILGYTSEVLRSDLEIIGHVQVEIWASMNVSDTDFIASLCDVYPSGEAYLVADGIIRAKFRNSLEEPDLVPQGKIQRYQIDLGETAMVFKRGHRMRVNITSSSFSRWAVNTNSGEKIISDRMKNAVPAKLNVFHSEEYGSRLVFYS